MAFPFVQRGLSLDEGNLLDLSVASLFHDRQAT